MRDLDEISRPSLVELALIALILLAAAPTFWVVLAMHTGGFGP